MKTADELFEELGYEKHENPKNEKFYIEYVLYDEYLRVVFIIQFWNDKTFNKTNDFGEIKYITTQELQAIYKKCEELKWI